MASALPEMMLWMASHQWQMLTRFAGSVVPLSAGANASDEAGRYLRYHHGYEREEWAQVEAFARAKRAEIEGAEIDARAGRFADAGIDDDTGFDASSVGQQFRLLFGFAAQYTLDAGAAAQTYLTRWHNVGAAEWEAVEAFLSGQEHFRANGGLGGLSL